MVNVDVKKLNCVVLKLVDAVVNTKMLNPMRVVKDDENSIDILELLDSNPIFNTRENHVKNTP